MLYPTLNTIQTKNIMTTVFSGMRRGLKQGEGEFYHTENLTTDCCPLATDRAKRGTVAVLDSPQGLAVKDGLVYADGADLYYNGERVPGLVLSTLPQSQPKRFVSMGAYLCVFPDNLYLNTADMSEYGSMEMSWEGDTQISYSICKGDGTAYEKPAVSKDEPSNPENGDLWIDTSGSTQVLKQYSKAMSMWAEIASVYIKIEAAGGRLGGKYYVSMRDMEGRWNMFAYDVKKGLWIREDGTHALFFADGGDDLYYIDADTKELKTVRGTVGEAEGDFGWEAVMGVMGYEYAEKKYLSRFKLRMSLEEGGWCEIYIQYDSCGIWEKSGVIEGRGVNKTFTIPIIPRRCDHLQIRLKGRGRFRLYSFARVLEKGSTH